MAWIKKGDDTVFDVIMGSFDGAEICELIGLYLLDKLSSLIGRKNVGLYRDDGLAAIMVVVDLYWINWERISLFYLRMKDYQ